MKQAVITVDEMRLFMVNCMQSVDTCIEHAEQLADTLIAADCRGHYSHGLNRLAMYARDVESGVTAKNGCPQVLSEKAATAWVDAKNLLGPVAGNYCMDLAIRKAKEAGVGWVTAKGCTHYGIAGWYSMRAVQQGMIGFSMTNTSPICAPTRSSKSVLGTNPISCAAPATSGDDFVLDMATTTVALGKVEMSARTGVTTVPNGWGVDATGRPSNDCNTILNGGSLCPLGGAEQTGGYKGYGLGLMVEVLCGILSGSLWGPNIRSWMSSTDHADLGQCFIAVDPSAFAPGFPDRLEELINTMRSTTPVVGCGDMMVAGDPEKEHTKLVDDLGGIPYHLSQMEFTENLAKSCKVKAPVVFKYIGEETSE